MVRHPVKQHRLVNTNLCWKGEPHHESPPPIALKVLNIALLVCFLATILVPLTGVIVHKMAATLFLLLRLIHTVAYRKKLNGKRYVMLAVIFLAYLTGLFGLILTRSL